MTPDVYNYDENGFYLGSSLACESPLEPGVYLCPAQATFSPPPACEAGSFPRFSGSEWEIYTPPAPEPEPVPPPPTPEKLWALLRSKRDGMLYASDFSQLSDVQAKLTDQQKVAWASYRQALRDLPETTADPGDPIWPTPPGGAQ